MLNYLEERDYVLLGELDDEEDVLEKFFEYYGSTYICDAISEIADSSVPVYTKEIWDNAYDIQEYIEEAIEEGLCNTDRGVDLTRIMMSGFYQFYSTSLYNNLETLVYNYIARKVDDYINGLNEEVAEAIDIEYVEERIEEEAGKLDNNSKFSDIELVVGHFMEHIRLREMNNEI